MKLKEAVRGIFDELTLETLTKSYEIIGDIILIRLPPGFNADRAAIGEALHRLYPRVRTVAAVPLYAHTEEQYRTREVRVIWGDERLETMHREAGCSFMVDLRHVFFSPRLAYERMRVARKVKPGETIINLFAGVGCFSIIIAKQQPQTRIYSIDLNSYAFNYQRANIVLNKLEGKVLPILGDAREEAAKLAGLADRVIMPLPEQAHRFLPVAVRALKRCAVTDEVEAGAVEGVIHYYAVATGREDEELFRRPMNQAREIIESSAGRTISVELEEARIVRSVGPWKYHIVLDLRVLAR